MNLNKPLLAILIVALFVRVVALGHLPLFGDEIDVGLQAASLSQNLHDYRGNFLPVYITSFTESRAPLLMYFTVPFIKVFGLSVLGVRLAPVIFGLVSLWYFYLLLMHLTNNKPLSLTALLLLSLTPWHIHYSRHAFEVTLLLSLILAGTYYFFLFIKTPKKLYNFLFVFLYALGFYTYNTANIFIPLLAIFLFVTNFNFFQKQPLRFYLFNIVLVLVLIAPIGLQTISGTAANRFGLISIFNQPKIVDEIIFKRTGFSSSPSIFEKFSHNRPLSFLQQFAQNYTDSFNPSFLFLKGDPLPRHGLPNSGLLLATLAPFLFMGLFGLTKNKTYQFFLFWLLLAPVPAALTQNGGNHATRLFLLLPPLIFFIASGLVMIRRRFILLLISLCILASATLFFHEYFTHYPKEQFESWQSGYPELFTSLPRTYNRLFISNRNYNSLPHYLFFQNASLLPIQSSDHPDTEKYLSTYDVDGFTYNTNIIFINSWRSKDIFDKIQELARPGDAFLLFQGKDIPGDYDFSKNPLPGFSTLSVISNPNLTLFGQVIQKL